jgi:hypothetical protein
MAGAPGTIWENVTADILAKAKFRGPVRFFDGRKGMARQDHECVDNPRFGYSWSRENRKDKGRIFYTVDGVEVASLDDAAALLLQMPGPNSPREQFQAMLSEGPEAASRRHALMDGEHFMRQGPFGMLMAFYQRSENAWHGGINRYSDILHKRGDPFPHWLYSVKSGTYEMARVMRLFAADRAKDAGLKCALGVSCRNCEILATIEAAMEEARTLPSGALPPRDIDDADIDAAKAMTCVGHVLTSARNVHVAEGIVSTREDREDRSYGPW